MSSSSCNYSVSYRFFAGLASTESDADAGEFEAAELSFVIGKPACLDKLKRWA